MSDFTDDLPDDAAKLVAVLARDTFDMVYNLGNDADDLGLYVATEIPARAEVTVEEVFVDAELSTADPVRRALFDLLCGHVEYRAKEMAREQGFTVYQEWDGVTTEHGL